MGVSATDPTEQGAESSAFSGGGGTNADLQTRAKVFSKARDRRRAKARAAASSEDAEPSPEGEAGLPTAPAAGAAEVLRALPPMARLRNALAASFGPKPGASLAIALTQQVHAFVESLEPEDAEDLLQAIAAKSGAEHRARGEHA